MSVERSWKSHGSSTNSMSLTVVTQIESETKKVRAMLSCLKKKLEAIIQEVRLKLF